jgi:signal transduction histidine kinase
MKIDDNHKCKNIRLLLVDDEEYFRETLSKRLVKRGLFSAQAASGNDCLSILEKKAMDVVVLDVKMPGMNGIEVLKHIKDHHPKTEVILLTGNATTSDGVEGIKSGAFDYLTKPIELEHLTNKIFQAYEKVLNVEAEQKEAEYRKKIEQQMIVTERLASLGTLAAGVAHEINNPLAIIRESTGWMKQLLTKDELKDMPSRSDLEKALGKVEKSVERASRITHQLLGFAKKSDYAISEVNLPELMQEAVQLVAHETKKRNIDIIWKIASPPDTIWSAPYEIRQALLNLLTNAVHAIGYDGSITMALKDLGDQLAVEVSDSGKGIPKENLNKIFEPFFSTKSPGKGTGLGLFVTRGMIEKLGGTVEAKSTVGQGSSFCVKLPKHPESTDKFNASSAGNWIENIMSHVKDEDKKEKKSS